MELGRQRGYTPRAFLSPLLAYPMHIPPQESRETLHMMVQEMGALALANTTTMVQVDMLDMVLQAGGCNALMDAMRVSPVLLVPHIPTLPSLLAHCLSRSPLG